MRAGCSGFWWRSSAGTLIRPRTWRTSTGWRWTSCASTIRGVRGAEREAPGLDCSLQQGHQWAPKKCRRRRPEMRTKQTDPAVPEETEDPPADADGVAMTPQMDTEAILQAL